MIERLFGHLKPLLRQLKPITEAAMKQALVEFNTFYNHVHRHISLQGRTPMEVWSGKTLADVQANGHSGRWVSAMGGLLAGFHLRC